jgi:hypothetical protein
MLFRLWVEAVWKRAHLMLRRVSLARLTRAASEAEDAPRIHEAKRALALRPHRLAQRCSSEDLDHPLQVVRQDLQAHLGSHPRQRLGQEVIRSHPALERAEDVLDGLTAQPHGFRCAFEPLLNDIQYVFVFPP